MPFRHVASRPGVAHVALNLQCLAQADECGVSLPPLVLQRAEIDQDGADATLVADGAADADRFVVRLDRLVGLPHAGLYLTDLVEAPGDGRLLSTCPTDFERLLICLQGFGQPVELLVYDSKRLQSVALSLLRC